MSSRAAVGADSVRRRSAAPAVAIAVVALLLLAAHFLRSFAIPFMMLFLLLPWLLAVRRPWAARVVQVALVLGALEWVTTTVRILGERRVTGEPAGRMLLIMGGVIGFTLLGAVLLETAGPRRRYGLRTGSLFATAPPAPSPSEPASRGGEGGPRLPGPGSGRVAEGAPSREDLLAVSAFADVFERPGFVAGAWRHPGPGPDGVAQMSYWEPEPEVQRWHDALYGRGIVLRDHEWDSALQREEMARYEAHPAALEEADLDTVRRVLTTISRADRFNEGYLGSMFEAGVAQGATRRLASLAAAE